MGQWWSSNPNCLDQSPRIEFGESEQSASASSSNSTSSEEREKEGGLQKITGFGTHVDDLLNRIIGAIEVDYEFAGCEDRSSKVRSVDEVNEMGDTEGSRFEKIIQQTKDVFGDVDLVDTQGKVVTDVYNRKPSSKNVPIV